MEGGEAMITEQDEGGVVDSMTPRAPLIRVTVVEGGRATSWKATCEKHGKVASASTKARVVELAQEHREECG